MKALSLRQPWAWLVVTGYKTIETRTWKTNYRGLLLIHASGKWDKRAEADYRAILEEAYRGTGLPILPLHNIERAYRSSAIDSVKFTGGIIGFVGLSACMPFTKLEWHYTAKRHLVPLGWGYEGRLAWHMYNATKFPESIACKGMLKLWTPAADIINKITELSHSELSNERR